MWAVRLKPLPIYPGGYSPRYTLGRRLGWTRNRSGHYGEEKKSCPCRKSNPDRPARCYADWAIQTHQDRITLFKIIRLFFCINAWCIFLFFISDFFPKIQLKRADIWLESQATSIHYTCCHYLFHNPPVLFESISVYLERNSKHLPSARQHQSQATWIPSLLLHWKDVTDTGRCGPHSLDFWIKIRIDKKGKYTIH
jgi:hypothetical protein